MNIDTVIPYIYIFGEKSLPVKDILKGIDSKYSIILFSKINAMVFRGATFIEILNSKILDWPIDTKKILVTLIENHFTNKQAKNSFFNRLCILKFIEFEYSNFRESQQEYTLAQEFNILKAYIAHSDNLVNKHKINSPLIQNDDRFWMQRKLWPILLGQIAYTAPLQISTEFYKSLHLLVFLYNDSRYKPFVLEFTKSVGAKNYANYIYDITQLCSTFRSIDPLTNTVQYRYKAHDTIEGLTENFTTNNEQLQNTSIHLYSKPVFKVENGISFVTDYQLFGNQLYLGTLFNFYNQSGIRKKHRKFDEFKGIIGKELVEDIIFSSTLKAIFSKKHQVLIFDTDQGQGCPDAYLRDGKNIYIFEYKETTTPSNIAEKASAKAFMSEIDKKVCAKKGIGQLVSTISSLESNNIEEGIWRKKKARNIRVYPILVTPDVFYKMPGVNDYLVKMFRDEIPDNLNFEVIQDPVHIPFDMLHSNMGYFKNYKLSSLIDRYSKYCKRIQNKREKGQISIKKALNGLKDFSEFITIKNEFNQESVELEDELLLQMKLNLEDEEMQNSHME